MTVSIVQMIDWADKAADEARAWHLATRKPVTEAEIAAYHEGFRQGFNKARAVLQLHGYRFDS